ncbi:inorganic phosphate transporter [Swingsia samuiensis]|uniref:Inorganic phosphate transporter n=1 Tax=Swingsia samuiensis TaxID=1293412 RepID=A0A4Y6UN44_9PROT|nr:inorganic phosphate transporter [Swingsia samuiensis]QDH17777.1 inorganic phosphate transporter [Swingsia samuiensis]
MISATLIAIVFFALLFDFTNGQHDASAAIGPVVTTGVLPIRAAVLLCALCNFLAFLVYGLHVAGTIGHGLVLSSSITPFVILCTLIASIIWNTLTLRLGIPSSSSHALIGSLVGSVAAYAGLNAIIWKGLLPIVMAIIISPLLGMLCSILIALALGFLLHKAHMSAISRHANWMQIVSCAFMSLAHGGNDAQKTMGILYLALISEHILQDHAAVPLWVVLSCQLAMALGTLFGGKAILHTMGNGITRLRPWQGTTAQISASLVLSYATSCGIPVSSTHTITGALAGVGSVRSVSAVRWRLLNKIFASWLITLPSSALFAAIFMKLLLLFK